MFDAFNFLEKRPSLLCRLNIELSGTSKVLAFQPGYVFQSDDDLGLIRATGNFGYVDKALTVTPG